MAIFKNRYKYLSDEQLMELIKRHNTSAFNELYNRYSQRLLYFFFRALGGNEVRAQDFLQEIFLKIVEKPNLFRSDKTFSIWIFTVAHNLCKNEYRYQDVRKRIENCGEIDAIPIIDDEDYHYTEKKIDQKLFEQALFSELDKLDADQRTVFLLRYQQQLSIKEISGIMGCTEGTVKSRLFYVTKKLARHLQDFNPYNVEVSQHEKAKSY